MRFLLKVYRILQNRKAFHLFFYLLENPNCWSDGCNVRHISCQPHRNGSPQVELCVKKLKLDAFKNTAMFCRHWVLVLGVHQWICSAKWFLRVSKDVNRAKATIYMGKISLRWRAVNGSMRRQWRLLRSITWMHQPQCKCLLMRSCLQCSKSGTRVHVTRVPSDNALWGRLRH